MPPKRNLENMTLVGDDYRITDSKDSTWQEWFEGTKYYLDEEEMEVVAVDYESFDNARNPDSNWEKVIQERSVEFDDLPEEVRKKVTFILFGDLKRL
jgi:hypothetical protein